MRKTKTLVLIKDIEQEPNITKSVASNLVKRMVQNGLGGIGGESLDKRDVCSSDGQIAFSNEADKAFFERIDNQLMEDIDEDELPILRKSLNQLQEAGARKTI